MKIDDQDLRDFISGLLDEKLSKLFTQIVSKLPAKEEQYYTIAQVCKRLELHKTTVYQFIGEKKLKAHKAGNMFRISETDLNEFLSQRPDYVIKKRRKFRLGKLIT